MEYGTNKNREVPDHHPGGPDLGIYSKVAPLQYRVGDGATGNMPSEKSGSGKPRFKIVGGWWAIGNANC
jgi:hypothetical protein